MSIIHISGYEEKAGAADRFLKRFDPYMAARRPEVLMWKSFVRQHRKYRPDLRGLNILVDLHGDGDGSTEDYFAKFNTPGFRIDRLTADVRKALYFLEVMGNEKFDMSAMQQSWEALIASVKSISGRASSRAVSFCNCYGPEHDDPTGQCVPTAHNISVRIHGDVRTVLGIYEAMSDIFRAIENDEDAVSVADGIDFIGGTGVGNGAESNVVQLVR